jgi:hypothetical protein
MKKKEERLIRWKRKASKYKGRKNEQKKSQEEMKGKKKYAKIKKKKKKKKKIKNNIDFYVVSIPELSRIVSL